MRKAIAGMAAMLLAACAGLPPELQGVIEQATPGDSLTDSEIAAGLREALASGTQRAVARIGVPDGFWLNRDLHIPLPEQLAKGERALRALGQSKTVDEFHLSLNRAAETAVPEAAAIFGAAIRGMTLADARTILEGGPTAATDYFRDKTARDLTIRFKPIVMHATASVGATRRYKELSAKIGKFASGFELQDIDAYVTDRALNGLFRTLADEEMRIRRDPAARSSALMKKVFAAQP
jgi:hypothetical protein